MKAAPPIPETFDAQLEALRARVMTPSLQVTPFASGAITLLLNRPAQCNALDMALNDALLAVFNALQAMSSIRAVFIRGAGDHFTAGADLKEPRHDVEGVLQRTAAMYLALWRAPQYVTALVHGVAYGGGVGLIAACDEAVATKSAKLCCPEARTGLIPAVISPYILRALGPRTAGRLFATARLFSAEEAYAMGLVQTVVHDASVLDTAAHRIVEQLRACAPGAVADAKKLRDLAGPPIDDALMAETVRRSKARAESLEFRDGVRAFRDKRKPPWALE